jgi:hypothetical protein
VSEYLELIKAGLNLGTTGLLIVVAGYLVNKWAGKFLTAQQDQAKAMGELAMAVRDGQKEQGELLLAMRVMAAKLDEVKSAVQSIAIPAGGRNGA